MRYSSTRNELLLMIGILLLGIGILGCGKSEEATGDQNTTHTRAMVPGTVGQTDDSATQTLPVPENTTPENTIAENPAADPQLNEAAGMAREESRQTAGGESGAQRMDQNATPAADEIPPPPAAEQVSRELDRPTTMTPPPPPPAPGKGRFSLQLGSHTVASFAEDKAQELRARGYPATVEPADVKGQLYYRVFIRGLADRAEAEKLGARLRAEMGFDYLVRERI